MRRSRHKLEVSTFPFLAVLLCAMGSLIFLLIVMDRRAKIVTRHNLEQEAETRQAARHADKTAKFARAKADRQAEFDKERDRLHRMLLAQEQEIQSQLASMTREAETAAQKLKKKQSDVFYLEDLLGKENGKLIREYQELMRTKTTAGQQAKAGELAEKEKLRMTVRLLELEKTLKDLKDLKSRPSDTFSLIPYQGKNGDKRKPVYVECGADGWTLHPNRAFVSNFDVTPARFRQEIEERAGMLEFRKRADPHVRDLPAGNQNAYVLFLVRPEGISNYDRAQQILSVFNIDYGYELVDTAWEFDFSGADVASLQPWQKTGQGPSKSVVGVRPLSGGGLVGPPGSGLSSGGGLVGPPGSGLSSGSGLVGPPGSGLSSGGGPLGPPGAAAVGAPLAIGSLPRGRAGFCLGGGNSDNGGPGGGNTGMPGYPGGSGNGFGPQGSANGGGPGNGFGPAGSGNGGAAGNGMGPGGLGRGNGPAGPLPYGRGPEGAGGGPNGAFGAGNSRGGYAVPQSVVFPGWPVYESFTPMPGTALVGAGGGGFAPLNAGLAASILPPFTTMSNSAKGPYGPATAGILASLSPAPSQGNTANQGPYGYWGAANGVRAAGPFAMPGGNAGPGTGQYGPPGTGAYATGQGGLPPGAQLIASSSPGNARPGTGPGATGQQGTAPPGYQVTANNSPAGTGSGTGGANGPGTYGAGANGAGPGGPGTNGPGGAANQSGAKAGTATGDGASGGGGVGEISSAGPGGGGDTVRGDPYNPGLPPGNGPPGPTPPGQAGPVNARQGPEPSTGGMPDPSGPRVGRRPGPAPLGRLTADHDFIIDIVCWSDGVSLKSTNDFYPLAPAENRKFHEQKLVLTIQRMIARRQASVRDGEPPYRPMIRLLVQQDGVSSFLWISQPLRVLQIPISRENLVD